LGIRDAAVVERTALARNFVTVATAWGKINIKEALLNGKVIKASPEYEDCKAIARPRKIYLYNRFYKLRC
jgi:uncharacterized protein (DUF111 family)